jgi:hypothetical protein
VHREQLVVLLRVHEGLVGAGELQADEEGLGPADQEEGECRDPVQDPDLLVVDGGDPPPEARSRVRAPEQAAGPLGGDAHGRQGILTSLQRVQERDQLVDLLA